VIFVESGDPAGTPAYRHGKCPAVNESKFIDSTAKEGRPFLLFRFVINENLKTTAFISVPDLREICKSVDSDIESGIAGVFAQKRTREKAMTYSRALSDPLVQVKTSWEIAESIGCENPGTVQSLMGENKWDHQDLWDVTAACAASLEDPENGDPLGTGIIADETADAKRGRQTAGVGYQYAGIAGGVINCTTWVSLALVGPRCKTWVSSDLYLPKKDWFTGRKETGTARRKKAGVPNGTRFATKPQIARKRFAHLRSIGIEFDWAGGDEVYGRCKKLLEDHERNGEAYAYFIPRNYKVETAWKQPMMVDELLKLTNPVFEIRSAGPGVNGPRYYEWALIGLNSPDHYVLVRKPVREEGLADGGTIAAGNKEATNGKLNKSSPGKSVNEDEESKEKEAGTTYCLCFVPPGSRIKPAIANLILMAGRRWGIEEANASEKGPIGWDENQFRKWNSLHRHTALAGLAALRANMIIRRIEEGASRGDARQNDSEIGELPEPGPSGPSEEEDHECNQEDFLIPVGDSAVPNSATRGIPDYIGFVRLTVNEVMRLVKIVTSNIDDMEMAFHLRWSKWRRRHQAIARWHHQKARLKKL